MIIVTLRLIFCKQLLVVLVEKDNAISRTQSVSTEIGKSKSLTCKSRALLRHLTCRDVVGSMDGLMATDIRTNLNTTVTQITHTSSMVHQCMAISKANMAIRSSLTLNSRNLDTTLSALNTAIQPHTLPVAVVEAKPPEAVVASSTICPGDHHAVVGIKKR